MRWLFALCCRMGLSIRNLPALLLAAGCGAMPGYFAVDVTLGVVGATIGFFAMLAFMTFEAGQRVKRFRALIPRMRRAAVETEWITLDREHLGSALWNLESNLPVRYVPVPKSGTASRDDAFEQWHEFEEGGGVATDTLLIVRQTNRTTDPRAIASLPDCLVLVLGDGEREDRIAAVSPSRFCSFALHHIREGVAAESR